MEQFIEVYFGDDTVLVPVSAIAGIMNIDGYAYILYAKGKSIYPKYTHKAVESYETLKEMLCIKK